jgi:hypothetical protein
LPLQTPLWQSLGALHCFPVAQAPQVVPPQSTSVSVPFFTESVQVAL